MSEYRGPWQIVPPDIEGWHERGYDVRSADNKVLCSDCISADVALLFAAAPELLEALRGSKELLGQLLRDEVIDEPTPEDVALFDAIDEAIAKAESSNRLESREA